MLVLSRQRDETIMIGDDVEITIVDIRGDNVRLGITAPPHIPVHRKEVYDAIQRENRAAAKMRPDEVPRVESLAKRKERARDRDKDRNKDKRTDTDSHTPPSDGMDPSGG